MDDVDDSVLIGGGHFVIGGEAEAAAEDIGADVLTGAGNISIGAAAAVALGSDEGVSAIDGLHVHGLPDRATFGIEGGKGIQDFLWGGFAGNGFVEIILFPAHLGSHGVFIENHAGKPEIGDGF